MAKSGRLSNRELVDMVLNVALMKRFLMDMPGLRNDKNFLKLSFWDCDCLLLPQVFVSLFTT